MPLIKLQRNVHQTCALAVPGWPVAPNFCLWATRTSQFFHRNHMLGTLDFTSSENWAPFSFSESTALIPK